MSKGVVRELSCVLRLLTMQYSYRRDRLPRATDIEPYAFWLVLVTLFASGFLAIRISNKVSEL
jgi:hypothetical protein